MVNVTNTFNSERGCSRISVGIFIPILINIAGAPCAKMSKAIFKLIPKNPQTSALGSNPNPFS